MTDVSRLVTPCETTGISPGEMVRHLITYRADSQQIVSLLRENCELLRESITESKAQQKGLGDVASHLENLTIQLINKFDGLTTRFEDVSDEFMEAARLSTEAVVKVIQSIKTRAC